MEARLHVRGGAAVCPRRNVRMSVVASLHDRGGASVRSRRYVCMPLKVCLFLFIAADMAPSLFVSGFVKNAFFCRRLGIDVYLCSHGWACVNVADAIAVANNNHNIIEKGK